MTLVCITNDLPEVRSCTHRNQHAEHCDGWQYRYNPDTQRDEATGRECTGCLPRKARRGLVCGVCFDGILHAVDTFPTLARMLAGVGRAVQVDNAGVRSAMKSIIPIESLRLDLNEANSFYASYGGDPGRWVSTTPGATDAVKFARAVWAIERNHPTEETAHRIRRTRCTKCRQLSLVWTPPRYFGDQVRVTCRADDCGLEMDQKSFEAIAAIERPRKEEAA